MEFPEMAGEPYWPELDARPRRNAGRFASPCAARAVFPFALFLSAIAGPSQMSARIGSADEPNDASRLVAAEGLEVSVWAKSPMFFNPTNIDVDERGRIWVTEAVNYRDFNSANGERLRHALGDRVVILEDTDRDGTADRSSVFVQDKDLVAPLGIAVFGNRVVVSCSPSILVYTDRNRDGRFEEGVDTKERFLTGFGGLDHDHGLHSVAAGPDGRWYFNAGNAGPHIVTDRSGWTLRAGGWYTGGTPHNTTNSPGLKSDDGRIYVGGLTMSMNADGTGLEVHGHNYRNNYETCVDSFGDLFQNDNDDQVVACRTTWLMQYANAGFSSSDGKRGWNADRRPDQSIPIAHWHQDDPGILPMGDLYGAGSPTGMVVYEGDALGDAFRGAVLSCEAGRNVVFAYRAAPRGAGFDLERGMLVSSGRQDDPNYKWNKVEQDERAWFRPSDAAVGIDGAVYVADWFDPIVGGHDMRDKVGAGAIYRITRKGEQHSVPRLDLDTPEGRIAAMRNPAPNVRFLGFERLRKAPDEARRAIADLRRDENPYVRARAIWLLAQLDSAGAVEVQGQLDDADPMHRIVAFRALRRAGADVVGLVRRLARDPSPAVRREAALALRDVGIDAARDLILELIEGYDGRDRWYLEAIGTACEGKEEAIFGSIVERFGATGDASHWSDAFADLVWRLHPTASVPLLRARIAAADVTARRRKQAVDALAFVADGSAAEAMVEAARQGPDDLRADADWWIAFRRTNLWQEYPIAKEYARPADLSTSIVAGVRLPGQAVYSSGTVRAGEMADILVDIAGAQHVFLVVTDAGDGNSCEWADWAEPRLLRGGSESRLTELAWERAEITFGRVRVDRNCEDMPLRIHGRPVPYGIGTHAPSVVVYDVGGQGFEWFAARGGLDNGREDRGGTDYPGAQPSVVFEVYHDGPTPESRARGLEATMLDPASTADARRDAALALAKSRPGGLRLLGLASQGKLSAELSEWVAEPLHRNPDLSVRALASRHFRRSSAEGSPYPAIEELVTMAGDAQRGRTIALGKGQCAACHAFGSEGKPVGPDLTYIAGKLDRTRLIDAILNPSATISFGYETWLVGLDDGQVLTGFVVGEGDPVVLIDAKGETHRLPADSIEFRKRQEVSIMPELARAQLTPNELVDVVEFLGGLSNPK